MKYDLETTNKLVDLFNQMVQETDRKIVVKNLAAQFSVPERSIIAKLSSLNLYNRDGYRNKRGEIPVKKEEYIERIAELMQVDINSLDSLEKCNKSVLILLEKALK